MTETAMQQRTDRFIADLERELCEQRLTLLDSEILAALESKLATRERTLAFAPVVKNIWNGYGR